MVGGLGRHVMELAPALAGQGVEVHLIVPCLAGGPLEEGWPGLFIHRVGVPWGYGQDFFSLVSDHNGLLLSLIHI